MISEIYKVLFFYIFIGSDIIHIILNFMSVFGSHQSLNIKMNNINIHYDPEYLTQAIIGRYRLCDGFILTIHYFTAKIKALM